MRPNSPLLVAIFLLASLPSFAAPPDRDPEVRRLLAEVRAEPDRVDLIILLGEAYRRQGTIEGRRAAGEVVLDALRRHPDAAPLLLSYGQLKVEQGFLSNAAGLFRRVIRLDPDQVDAHFGLARLTLRDYRRYIDKRYLDQSNRALDRVLALNPDHREALFFRAFVRHQSGDTTGADASINRLIRRYPDDPWGYLVLEVLSMESGRAREAEWAEGKAMSRIRDPELVEAFETLLYLDPLAEETRLLLSGTERQRFLVDFWKKMDPTPATALNERRLEHVRRVVTADLFYGIREKKIRGWSTAPGEAIIRYGTPIDRQLGVGSTTVTGFAPPALFQVHSIKGEPVTFTFEDRNLSGFWVQPFNGGQPTTMDVEMCRSESVYEVPKPGPAIRYLMEPAQFRGANGRTRVELLLGVPDPDAGKLDLKREVAIYNPDWACLMNDVGFLDPDARIADRKSPGKGILVDILEFTTDLDSVRVGSQMSDGRNHGFGAGLEPLKVRRFDGPGLLVSDLVLMDRVGFEARDDRFARPGGWGIPNPGRVYGSGENIPVYFEVYNLLAGGDGLRRYALHIRVDEAGWKNPRRSRPALFDLKEPDRPKVEARFEESGPGRDLKRLLDVAVGALPPGSYRLTVTVEDLNGGATAEGTTRFRIANAPDRAARER